MFKCEVAHGTVQRANAAFDSAVIRKYGLIRGVYAVPMGRRLISPIRWYLTEWLDWSPAFTKYIILIDSLKRTITVHRRDHQVLNYLSIENNSLIPSLRLHLPKLQSLGMQLSHDILQIGFCAVTPRLDCSRWIR